MANILIVDDDYGAIEQVQEFLESLGHDVIFTLYPEHLFEILDEEHVDLILLDVYMPQVKGTDLLKQIKASHKHTEIPVIMLTSDQDEALLFECFSNGASDFVTKPFSKVTLEARVNSTLKTRENIEQLKEFLFHDSY